MSLAPRRQIFLGGLLIGAVLLGPAALAQGADIPSEFAAKALQGVHLSATLGTFADGPSAETQWYGPYMAYAVANGVLKGMPGPGGSPELDPDGACTAAQFAELLYRCQDNWSTPENPASLETYGLHPAEAAATGNWYDGAVQTLAGEGIVTADQLDPATLTLANPNAPITRYEAAVWLGRFIRFKILVQQGDGQYLNNLFAQTSASLNSFNDLSQSLPHIQDILLVAGNGIMVGFPQPDNIYSFGPGQILTRAQAAKVIDLVRFAVHPPPAGS